jgi:hypothetical protein
MLLASIDVCRDPETRKRNYIGQPIRGGLRAAEGKFRKRDVPHGLTSPLEMFGCGARAVRRELDQ